MKPTAYLINTARGPIVDQKALTKVLQNRGIAGAGLDVLEKEPPDADDPILKLDNVILAPHALCWTDQCFAGNGAADVKAVLDVQHGREPRGVVNRRCSRARAGKNASPTISSASAPDAAARTRLPKKEAGRGPNRKGGGSRKSRGSSILQGGIQDERSRKTRFRGGARRRSGRLAARRADPPHFIKRFGQAVRHAARCRAGRCHPSSARRWRRRRCSSPIRQRRSARRRRWLWPPPPKARRTVPPTAPSRPPSSSAASTLNMTYEAGLQALDPRNFSGPLWEQLTGIKSTVVELPSPDMYSKPVAEHIAGSGAYDVLDLQPQWTPALADGGVIAPLDDYIAEVHEHGGSRRLSTRSTRRCRPTRARSGASSTTATCSPSTTARTSSRIRS